jgi:DNA-binding LacI/PurR family transcriptional regulator
MSRQDDAAGGVIRDETVVVARVTLQTVADRVGVSRMTVSNAFSRPDQLSAELRRKILEAADELGYAGPDPAARALATGTTGAVGVLLTDPLQHVFTDEIAAMFFGAVAQELGASGLALTLLTSGAGEGHVPARDVPMDAALVFSCEAESTAVDWLRRRRLPLVSVDQDPMPGITSINVDDRGGARAAVQHLIDLGHRRVGIVTTRHGAPAGVVCGTESRSIAPAAALPAAGAAHVERQRMTGWLDALVSAGASWVAVEQPHSSESTGRAAAAALLDLAEPPTAVVCFSDVMAYGVVQAALDRDLDVPGDLSVVGFDDNPLASRMRPTLTTVRQDVRIKGSEAARELQNTLARARRGVTGRARRVLLPTDLVVRESTSPPKHRH